MGWSAIEEEEEIYYLRNVDIPFDRDITYPDWFV
jgi:hypothetical protein